ncbi:hypothetical protein PpBr36_02971 [Pyricularia pennisetigena]|uniref:hypothetical protein n=1 Tax=Pyricularia pennisetigena TaxID=1578925 RepID=UPI00114DF0E3|nr:hypothetical protein PpBr36_02971 [Pyricularia pennisetigena]TLS31151.1 hypothetical protein PpBr36_02971 [Pyricularia pennisetigena]
MTTPVPVPSKAAIRALRGLVFGTTCSLALVLETRRRRISTVQTAMHNGQRIKSHERYRADAADATIRALEEEILLQSSRPNYYADENPRSPLSRYDLPWEAREPLPIGGPLGRDAPKSQNTRDHVERQESPDYRDEERAKTGVRTSNTTSTETRTKRHLFVHHTQLKEPRRSSVSNVKPWSRAALGSMRLKADPISTAASRVVSLCATGKKEDLVRAMNLLDSVFEAPMPVLEPHLQHILQSTATLSRALQEAGSLSSAVKLMSAILRLHRVHRLVIDEELYWSHSPLPLADFVMAQEIPQYDLAIDLFAPKFSKKPGPTNLATALDVLKTGEKLFTRLLSRQSFRRMDKVLKRVKCYSGIPGGHEFELRILRQLFESGERVRVVEFFLTQASTDDMSLQYESCFFELGDMVFGCVSDLGGYKAFSVLERLLQARPQDHQIKVEWATQLLYLDWREHGQLDKLIQGFEVLEQRRFPEAVSHADAPYRAMIQIMLEAGDESGARRFFEKLVAQMPSKKTDGRINLLFALARAKAGDFATMHTMLEEISKSQWAESTDRAACLVPILQAFSEKHTIKQTEEFLRDLLESFQVKPSTYMLTFMAKLYGGVRDTKSLIGWIKFCINSGLKPGPHYTNALLRSCHIDWKFHFLELRQVHRLLQRQGPESTDQVTANIMSKAALASPSVHKKGTISFALSTKHKSVSRQAVPDRHTVAIAMGKSIENNTPLKAVNLYKHAVSMGMPHCQRCLRLFVDASLNHYGEANIQGTLSYLQRVQEEAKVDTRGAISHVLAWQIKNIDCDLGYEHLERRIQEMLRKMRAAKLIFSGKALNGAAKLYSEAGNHQGAIGLALMAADEQGLVPGYCVTNFAVLLDGYIHTQQPDMIAGLVQTATALGHWDKLARRGLGVLKRLKHWRSRIEQVVLDNPGSILEKALLPLETAIAELKSCRRRFEEDERELKGMVQDIIKHAALQAEKDSACRFPGAEEIKLDVCPGDITTTTTVAAAAAEGMDGIHHKVQGIAEAG